MEAYEHLAAARAKDRPTGLCYIRNLFTDFTEMHGDRRFGDDKAVVAGVARLCGVPVTVIAQEKGSGTKERVRRNFGSPHPEGYRKALRQMKLAEKFGRPVICFVDTAGAFCGISAEERGEGEAIAENLMEMSALKTPVLSVFVGEGGSGGALALAVADEVWILEHACYSVISPEGCASILWKDSSQVSRAAQCLKMTSQDLLELKIVDRVIPEPADFNVLYDNLKTELYRKILSLQSLETAELLRRRYERFRSFGEPE